MTLVHQGKKKSKNTWETQIHYALSSAWHSIHWNSKWKLIFHTQKDEWLSLAFEKYLFWRSHIKNQCEVNQIEENYLAYQYKSLSPFAIYSWASVSTTRSIYEKLYSLSLNNRRRASHGRGKSRPSFLLSNAWQMSHLLVSGRAYFQKGLSTAMEQNKPVERYTRWWSDYQ